jgi:hypothetical protein
LNNANGALAALALLAGAVLASLAPFSYFNLQRSGMIAVATSADA